MIKLVDKIISTSILNCFFIIKIKNTLKLLQRVKNNE